MDGFRPCRPPLPSPSAGHQARLIPLFASLRCALAVTALTSSRRQGARPTIKPSKLRITGRVSVTVWKYALHRYVLHHVPYIKEMHEAHHDDRRALIVTPVWLSLGSFAGFLVLPMWLVANPTVTVGVTAGMMLGYFCFEGVHHVLHHLRIQPGTYAYRLKRRRMLHHHFDDGGNFGVTNGFWDMVFGTDVKVRGSAPAGD